MIHIAHNPVRKDVFVAIAITTLIAMAAVHLVVLGPFLGIFIPLPILYYRSKLGRSSGFLILAAVSLIMTWLVGRYSIGTAVFFFEIGLVGLILPELFQMNLSVEKTVGITAGVVLMTGALVLAVYSWVLATGPVQMVSNYLDKSLNLALAMYQEMDASQESVEIVAQSLEGILYFLVRIVPSIVIVATLLVVWSNLLMAKPLFRSRRIPFPDFGELNEWKAPEPLVWVAIGSGILLLIGHSSLRVLGMNGLVIMMMIYFFQGIAIVSFYMGKRQFPKLLRTVLYVLIAVQQFLLLIVIAMGFFDMWIDFRRIGKVET